MWLLQNVFYICSCVHKLECVQTYAMHVLLMVATQRRQVKLINVPLKVLCPLFMTKVVEVCSTFRARVGKAVLEKKRLFHYFFLYLPLPLVNRSNMSTDFYPCQRRNSFLEL